MLELYVLPEMTKMNNELVARIKVLEAKVSAGTSHIELSNKIDKQQNAIDRSVEPHSKKLFLQSVISHLLRLL